MYSLKGYGKYNKILLLCKKFRHAKYPHKEDDFKGIGKKYTVKTNKKSIVKVTIKKNTIKKTVKVKI